MILYHAITTYHIFKFVIHKLLFHPDERAVLLIPNFLVQKPIGLLDMDVSIFNEVYFFSWEGNTSKTNSEKFFEELTFQIHKELNHKIEDFSEINVAHAGYSFGIWLAENNIPFQWFEEADGRLSQPEPIMKDDERLFPLRYQLALERGLYTGNNPSVIKKYVKKSSQIPNFYDPSAIDFDPVAEMKKFSQPQKKKLLQFFGVPLDLKFGKNSVLMLTQHFANLRTMSYEEHALCYQLTADYYLEGYNIYYKWHPSDLMPYPYFLEVKKMISGSFPSELLILVCDDLFEIGASINSTGIYNIESICKKILTFNQEYSNTFWYNHQYYFALNLINTLPEYDVKLLGVNSVQFNNLVNFSPIKVKNHISDTNKIEISTKNKIPTIYIIGEMNTEEVTKSINNYSILDDFEDVFVFLNCQHENLFFSWMSIIQPIVKEIQTTAIEQDKYGTCIRRDYIYIFVSKLEIKERIKKMKYVKNLLNTGVKTTVLPLSNKDEEILALRGMLKATEEQLLECIEENKRLIQNSQ